MLCKVQLAASLALCKAAKVRLRQLCAVCSWAGDCLLSHPSAHCGSTIKRPCAVQGAAEQVVSGRKRRTRTKAADKADQEDADQEQASDLAHQWRLFC